jgi:hypothetical protein
LEYEVEAVNGDGNGTGSEESTACVAIQKPLRGTPVRPVWKDAQLPSALESEAFREARRSIKRLARMRDDQSLTAHDRISAASAILNAGSRALSGRASHQFQQAMLEAIHVYLREVSALLRRLSTILTDEQRLQARELMAEQIRTGAFATMVSRYLGQEYVDYMMDNGG